MSYDYSERSLMKECVVHLMPKLMSEEGEVNYGERKN